MYGGNDFQRPGWVMARMAHQPGAALHIAHGVANAMLLPTVMELTSEYV
ncbi:hypothetical protein ACLK2I_13500 [Escherichia coli]